ncbi:MAG: DNA cytosine methyltransferase [Candidatus Helarchaeota archaeon]|nr:DNA cytosine methyltransferase [Candidatus Helarchaeota archaeon]
MINVIDLFCGAGGFSWGFKDSPYNVELAIDIDPIVCKTYKLNFAETKVIKEDISKLHSLDILKFIEDSIDVIISSPPCEAFTNANKRRQKNPLDRIFLDEQGRLVLHTIRLIGDISPKLFIIENVPQLGVPELKGYLKDEFKRVGYQKIYFNLLRAQNFGSASKRSRLFITNFKIDPKKNKKLQNLSIIKVLESLPDPRSIHNIPNHQFIHLTEKKMKKIIKIRWGDSAVFYQAVNRINTNWKKLYPDQICPTILGTSRYIHPYDTRILTVREQARLQGFPDDFIFFGNPNQQYNQVGEAVPPPMSKFLANFILKNYFEGN